MKHTEIRQQQARPAMKSQLAFLRRWPPSQPSPRGGRSKAVGIAGAPPILSTLTVQATVPEQRELALNLR